MEGGVDPTPTYPPDSQVEGGDASSSSAAVVALPCPPLDLTSVGSPLEEASESQPPTSDEDRDLDHEPEPGRDCDRGGDDQDQDHASPAGTGCHLTDGDLKQMIIKQVEYYFSDENLPTDAHLLSFVNKNKEGFVPIRVIASFRKMKKLTRDHSYIATALRESTFLVVSPDGKKVKRCHPLPHTEDRDPKLCTVLIENLPEDHSVENLNRMFGEVGQVKKISIHDPSALQDSKKGGKSGKLHSTKLHALIEYETVEAAEKAVATFNNEEDWRNGMHVKLLKRMAKHGQRRGTWRGPDSEKNDAAHSSDHTGGREDHSSEHQDCVFKEEDGDHITKEKNGDRSRNHGKARRYKHRGMNGYGHGTTTSHISEPSKPPPGPRMPDGTRGFTMGRGRPLVSDQI